MYADAMEAIRKDPVKKAKKPFEFNKDHKRQPKHTLEQRKENLEKKKAAKREKLAAALAAGGADDEEEEEEEEEEE